LLLLAGLNLAVRFALFPALDYRYYLFFVAVITVAGLQVFARLLPASPTHPVPVASVT